MYVGAVPRTQAVYGQGTGPIFIDNVVCNGQELRLLDCASNALAAHDCTHFQDAGVVCMPMISRKHTYRLYFTTMLWMQVAVLLYVKGLIFHSKLVH